MQRRPAAAALSPMPSPVLLRKRSSLVSNSSGPHTPTGGNAPLPVFVSSTNRYSTDSWDSWDSSNYDASEMEWEWKPEQIRLVTRTLDALPSHLLTPFNGPVPPSNLLDKIARGLTHAKGPIDWPHSLRATRAKIVELARTLSQGSVDGDASDTIAEEESVASDIPLKHTTNVGPKRPLYRQSSMDFVETAKADIKDNTNIHRLSRRLQKTDRVLTSSAYHPYARYTRAPSPTFGSSNRKTPSLNPSTPSSTTLNSTISESRSCRLQRSVSSLSSSSDIYASSALNPRVQRIKRSETFSGSAPCSPRSLKRAPSFGASSRNSMESVTMSIDRDSDVTSDEEEKVRSKKAKKARTKAPSPTQLSPSFPLTSPAKVVNRPTATAKTPSSRASKAAPYPATKPSKTSSVQSSTKPRMTLERNPSMLGPELPNPQPTLPLPATLRSTRNSGRQLPKSPDLPRGSPMCASPATRIPTLSSPQTPGTKSLKRTKASIPTSRRPPARKISFGSLAPSLEDQCISGGAALGLGSAFQLR